MSSRTGSARAGRRTLVGALAAAVCATTGLVGATPAAAAVTAVTLTVVSDGVAPFDTVDTGPANGRVRTGDVLTYGWSYSSDGAGAAAVTFVQTLTAAAEVRFDASNTAQCTAGAGSISADGHTLTCPVTVAAGGTGLVPITVTVPATVPDGGTVGGALTATGGLDGGSRSTTVAALPQLNLRANLLGAATTAGPGGVAGRGFNYGFVVTEPADRRGSELVTAPLTFTADLSALSPNAALVAGSCTPMNRGDYGVPYGRIGIAAGAVAANSVVDSGTVSCAQSARVVTVTITGADLGGSSVPTRGANGAALAVAESYLATGFFTVFVPDADITAAGGTIKATLQYRGFDPGSISGTSNYGTGYEPGGEPGAATCPYADANIGRSNDNCHSTTYGGRSANYDGSFYTTGVLSGATPAGGATSGDSGDGVVSPGEVFHSRLQIGSVAGPTLTGAGICDRWDPALSRIGAAGNVYRGGTLQSTANYTVQYATLPMTTDAERRTTSCGAGTWSDTIADAGGAGSVNAIRFLPRWTIANGEYDFFYVGFVAQPNPVGTILANFDGARLGTDETWGPSFYVKATNSPTYTGDRLTLGDGRLRVTQANNLGAGQFTEAGASYTYTLTPTVSRNTAATERIGGVVLVDTLPPCVEYVPGTASVPVQPVAGANGADGIPCTGDVGETGTVLRLQLGSVPPNVAVTPVTVGVTALRITPDSTASPNTVVITADAAVPVDLAKRTATAGIVIRNQTQFTVSETTTTPQIQVGDDARYLIAYRNVTGSVIPSVRMVTELPYTGDAQSSVVTGTLAFSAVSRKPAGATVECTTDPHGTINPDPASPANTWSATCGAGTTAVRITVPDVANTATDAIGITLTSSGNAAGDRYATRTRGTYTLGGSTVAFPATEVAVAEVVAASIGGAVWSDGDGDGVLDTGEAGLAGFPVDLTGTDDRGATVTRTTSTGGTGGYLFASLRSGTYRVTFRPTAVPAGSQFSPQAQGTDRSLDSDGDPATGVTAVLTLARGVDLRGIGQGVRTAAPTVTLTRSPATVAFGSAVTLTATVRPAAATGTVTFTDAVVSGPFAGSARVLGTAPVSGGVATLSTALPAFGANTVTAAYGGDPTYPAATSAPVTVENSAATTALLVTEFRLSGPAGGTDQYVELTNTGTVPLPLAGVVVRTAAGTVVTLARTTPTLAAGRAYLIAGTAYSLGLVAAADLNVSTLGASTGGVRVTAPDTAGTVTDAVGSTAGYSTGTALPALTGTPTAQYAFVRLAQNGTVQDTDDNARDFLLVSTGTAAVGGVSPAAGSPSPSAIAGPAARPATLRSTLLAPAVPQAQQPNRVYAAGAAGAPGTLTVRRTITNTTGSTLSAVRVRITSLSEARGAPQPGVATQPTAPAQLRAVEPATATSTVTVGGVPVLVQNLTPDVPVPGAAAGGLNTTLAVPLPGGGLLDGGAVQVAFTFAVDVGGTFWFGYVVEA